MHIQNKYIYVYLYVLNFFFLKIKYSLLSIQINFKCERIILFSATSETCKIEVN